MGSILQKSESMSVCKSEPFFKLFIKKPVLINQFAKFTSGQLWYTLWHWTGPVRSLPPPEVGYQGFKMKSEVIPRSWKRSRVNMMTWAAVLTISAVGFAEGLHPSPPVQSPVPQPRRAVGGEVRILGVNAGFTLPRGLGRAASWLRRMALGEAVESRGDANEEGKGPKDER